MCTVSVVMDYWGQRPETVWTQPAFDDFKEIIRRLDKLDTALQQPDCHDPAKAAWMREVEARLTALETEG